MSQDAVARLRPRDRLNYRREVYKPLKKLIIDTDRVNDEKTLAQFLMLQFSAGTYDALGFNQRNRKFTKQLFKVVLWGNLDTKWGYQFEHTRGIARQRSFWVPE